MYKTVKTYTVRIDLLSKIDCFLFTFTTNLQLQLIVDYTNENLLKVIKSAKAVWLRML
jgi:hypothetical protein